MALTNYSDSGLDLDFDLFIDATYVDACLSNQDPFLEDNGVNCSTRTPRSDALDHASNDYGSPNQFGLHLESTSGYVDRSQRHGEPAQKLPAVLLPSIRLEDIDSLPTTSESCTSVTMKEVPVVGTESLIAWYNEHKDNPYPGKDEIMRLAKASGKTEKSTRTWFANERRRKDGRRNSRGSGNNRTSLDLAPAGELPSEETLDASGDIYASHFDGEVPRSSSSVSVAGESRVMEGNSIDSLVRAPRRKGKRRSSSNMQASPLSSEQSEAYDANKPYFCTLCGIQFREKHDWARHEATHLPEMWHCMPDGSAVVYDHCAFCGLFNPRVLHFKTHHNVEACKIAPSNTRSFARKDKLRDHINRVHLRCPDRKHDPSKPRNCSGSDLLDGWFREPPDLATNHPAALWCGFCQITFLSWTERMDHVGEHLQRREIQSTWRPLNEL